MVNGLFCTQDKIYCNVRMRSKIKFFQHFSSYFLIVNFLYFLVNLIFKVLQVMQFSFCNFDPASLVSRALDMETFTLSVLSSSTIETDCGPLSPLYGSGCEINKSCSSILKAQFTTAFTTSLYLPSTKPEDAICSLKEIPCQHSRQ
ncbi:hypothetical protein VNO78_19837 [Psophocarpus tetragonolobus]|uniref:Uncharacterized protein n=1 Tax=Psophocarpus tetragonolobus TaxID=3891 RepID=A0AAN9S8U4_PSOTE